MSRGYDNILKGIMNNLKDKPIHEYSSYEVITIITEYLCSVKESVQKSNISDEDFKSPSWALKQAYNNGSIKCIDRLLNFIPKKINDN